MVQQRDGGFRPAPAASFDPALDPADSMAGAADDDREEPLDDAPAVRPAARSALDAQDAAGAPTTRRVVEEPESRPVAAAMTSVPSAREPVPDVAGARPPGGPRTVEPRQERPARADAGDAEAGPADPSAPRASCTAPQLRRFIKSRAYVPMHELRRRFAINGEDDDVCAVEVDAHQVYVGLPPAEGRLLGELFRNGEVGYELSMDPETPIVVGVYSMRPITRS